MTWLYEGLNQITHIQIWSVQYGHQRNIYIYLYIYTALIHGRYIYKYENSKLLMTHKIKLSQRNANSFKLHNLSPINNPCSNNNHKLNHSRNRENKKHRNNNLKLSRNRFRLRNLSPINITTRTAQSAQQLTLTGDYRLVGSITRRVKGAPH